MTNRSSRSTDSMIQARWRRACKEAKRKQQQRHLTTTSYEPGIEHWLSQLSLRDDIQKPSAYPDISHEHTYAHMVTDNPLSLDSPIDEMMIPCFMDLGKLGDIFTKAGADDDEEDADLEARLRLSSANGHSASDGWPILSRAARSLDPERNTLKKAVLAWDEEKRAPRHEKLLLYENVLDEGTVVAESASSDGNDGGVSLAGPVQHVMPVNTAMPSTEAPSRKPPRTNDRVTFTLLSRRKRFSKDMAPAEIGTEASTDEDEWICIYCTQKVCTCPPETSGD